MIQELETPSLKYLASLEVFLTLFCRMMRAISSMRIVPLFACGIQQKEKFNFLLANGVISIAMP